jgi:hypothetical protein
MNSFYQQYKSLFSLPQIQQQYIHFAPDEICTRDDIRNMTIALLIYCQMVKLHSLPIKGINQKLYFIYQKKKTLGKYMNVKKKKESLCIYLKSYLSFVPCSRREVIEGVQ